MRPSTRIRPARAVSPAIAGRQALRHPLVTTLLAVLVWAAMLRLSNVGDMSVWGLVGAVSPIILLAPLVAMAAFTVSLLRGQSDGVLTTHIAGIILMLYGAGAMVGNSVQARIVLRHEGITDQVLRSGSIDPTIDAYFNWPGFFTFFAYVREVSGIESFAAAGIWVPVFLNLAFLAPLLVIFRYATADRRIVWTSVLLFYIGNWIGQDYFAPQAVAYCLHLTMVAILLHYYDRPATAVANRFARAAHLVVVMLLFLAIVPSHQLTPPLTIVSVIGLVVADRCSARRLPHFMVGVFLTWLVFMSSTYLAGNLSKMLELVGDVGAAAGANVTERVGGSAAHRLVVILRLAFTGLFGLLAAFGLFRKRNALERSDRGMLVLAVVPTVLIALQPYGGEMVLRVFMFTLPFVAFYAAHAIRWDGGSARGRFVAQWIIAVPAVVVLTLLFMVARYGNAALDQFSSDERNAINIVYEDAPPGSLLLVAVDNVAWKYRGYDTYDHRSIDRVVRSEIDPRVYASAAVSLMYQRRDAGAYFIATESQQSYIDLLGGLPSEALRAIEEQLNGDPNIQILVDRPTIRIYRLPPDGEES
ncbi:MAG: hypothetical protein HKN03_06495 [Acidimicrobiales bacterium]|nr:hypothetical protein [Acidimicrobiales bacterium]